MLQQGVPVASSLLFFGCRNPEKDYRYADELAAFEEHGVVSVRTAFYRVPGQVRRYVQDAITSGGDEVWAMLQQGAPVFVSRAGISRSAAVPNQEGTRPRTVNRHGPPKQRLRSALSSSIRVLRADPTNTGDADASPCSPHHRGQLLIVDNFSTMSERHQVRAAAAKHGWHWWRWSTTAALVLA